MKGKRGWIAVVLIMAIVMIIFLLGIYLGYLFFKSSEDRTGITSNKDIINSKNSVKERLLNYSNKLNSTNKSVRDYNERQTIEEGIKEFNEEYINYILSGLGVDKLHSAIGFGNPIIELVLDEEVWSSEIINKIPNTIKQSNDNKDIKVILTKEEAVKAILSDDVSVFMKNSVANGNTEIKMIAGNTELFAKGYLSVYKSISGKVVFKVNL
jgi:hypothetical protein